jgi:hypothetical protein
VTLTGHFDVNTMASWAAVLAAVFAAFRWHAKASRWLLSVDERFKDQQQRNEDVDKRLSGIEKDLKPNGGGSHHDIVIQEIRKIGEALAEAAEQQQGREP